MYIYIYMEFGTLPSFQHRLSPRCTTASPRSACYLSNATCPTLLV